MRLICGFPILLVLAGSACASSAQAGQASAGQPSAAQPSVKKESRSVRPKAMSAPAALFQRGQDELNRGQLDEAERDFRHVLAMNPKEGGAYANLGVVYMRRRKWAQALTSLRRAQRLLPREPGIRLNIGLAYFRQNEFSKAIPSFESVVKEQTEALQPRYLLGLCYFFVDRWKDAAATLEPLWPQESGQPNYLYVLTIAAHRAGEKELDDRALSQLVRVGSDSPVFHLYLGKAHLNLEQYDMALSDFQAAAQADPKLPFVHFNLGLTYLKKMDYEKARDEFLNDSINEPDLALNFEELGDVYSRMEQDANAEKSYRQALQLDGSDVNAYVGLAKAYQREEQFQKSLSAIDAAQQIEPERTDIHYVRGQTLLRMGRKAEGKKELETAVRLDNERRAQREKEVETGTIPSPELLQEKQ